MNHPFLVSWTNPNICAVKDCHRDKISHGPDAICEACSNVGPCELFGSKLLLCKSCTQNEYDSAKSISKENEPVNEVVHKVYSLQTASLIQVREQYFNAEVISINNLSRAIDDNKEIPQEQKRYEKAKAVQLRIEEFKKALFEVNEEQTKITNQIRADIVYLNNKASELSAKEREELKLKDLNYQPNATPVSKIKIAGPKLTKSEKIIEDYAKLMKISVEQARHVIAANISVASKK